MTAVATERDRVLDALGAVRDPELDEPITTLGFVSTCVVSAAGDVVVRLRLPTYFCAPNFAFLMVADAYDAVTALPWVRTADVALEDHFAATQINAGVAARAGFAGSFAGEAAGELDELRRTFVRKAVLAGTDVVCRPLVAAGIDPVECTIGDVSPSVDLDRLLRRRAELGLPTGPDAPLLVDVGTGAAISPADAARHLGLARLTRTGIEANTGICRGMLRHRYAEAGAGEEELG
ncbi:iron-sulfur cluster assembly protein [Kribbella sp.]|uniref:iron-sulfur cluster assembly protein n=1 Tax=Kribbella sp. TaxID=1871183 RepID=UPI002D6786F5|nr:iron-sulfur cluster assembly protein [Kribbella sp.]HZX03259.1 iron-sulfur cluster assembly protein [Kribbella sp.]